MVSTQPRMALHLLAVAFVAASAAEGAHVNKALTARPRMNAHQHSNKTAVRAAQPNNHSHTGRWRAPFPWWLAPVWGPVLRSMPWVHPSDDEPIAEAVEEEIEEVEEEVESFGGYEKRKWLHIFESRNFFDWAVFATFAMFFLWVYHRFMVGLPSLTKYHGLAIAGWVGIGLLYNAFMYAKFGSEQATVWLNGYLLELIFSLENIFVFHVVVESFGTPTVCVQKALFFIVCCQVVFELVLYMGVADVIDSMGFLPYVLGAWLTYLGIHSAFESDDHSEFDILETCTVRLFRRVLGDRLQLDNDDHGNLFRSHHGHFKMTMLGLVFFCLLGADFFLEIDVTLTKIEQTSDDYLSFTSSALAGFAVPELFFVARDLFRRFALLKFGISFVLVFYGTQMLFPGMIVLSPIEGCGVIVMVMILCILLSVLFRKTEPETITASERRKLEEVGWDVKRQSDADAAAGIAVGGYGATTSNLQLRKDVPMRRNHYSFVFERGTLNPGRLDDESFETPEIAKTKF